MLSSNENCRGVRGIFTELLRLTVVINLLFVCLQEIQLPFDWAFSFKNVTILP